MSLLPKKRKERLDNPLVTLRAEMNRLFDDFRHGDFLPESFPFTRGFPNVEVTETDDEIVVRAELPGLEAKDVEVTLSGGTLTLKGEKREEKEEKEEQTRHREVHYGSFSRSIRLPGEVNPDKVDAKCKNGICTIKLARVKSKKSKKIKITGE